MSKQILVSRDGEYPEIMASGQGAELANDRGSSLASNWLERSLNGGARPRLARRAAGRPTLRSAPGWMRCCWARSRGQRYRIENAMIWSRAWSAEDRSASGLFS